MYIVAKLWSHNSTWTTNVCGFHTQGRPESGCRLASIGGWAKRNKCERHRIHRARGNWYFRTSSLSRVLESGSPVPWPIRWSLRLHQVLGKAPGSSQDVQKPLAASCTAPDPSKRFGAAWDVPGRAHWSLLWSDTLCFCYIYSNIF